uniref:CCHC-type domain-containing protein n=1 Tax=Auxenochlorella protothecoides TaxID=3075 RepID=A0A1D1ZRQ0_AUXPR
MSRRELQFLDAQDEDDASSSQSGSPSASEDETGYPSSDDDSPAVCSDRPGPSAAPQPVTPPLQAGRKISIKLGGTSSELTCHVCGKKGHCAGFIGARYFDCPNKPCYLCGQSGHSTMTCPFRIDPGHGCSAAPGSNPTDGVQWEVLRREQGAAGAAAPGLPPQRKRWQVESAVLRLHDRRVVCLEFHPRNQNIVLSGSKGGRIAVWDMEKVYERTVYRSINFWLTSALKFAPGSDGLACATCSYDSTVKIFDVETGAATTLHTATPREWRGPVEEDGSWITQMAMDVMQGGIVVAGDNKGMLYFCDPRHSSAFATMQAHKKGTKVQSVAGNPVDANLLLTAGNDYAARLLDLRVLGGKQEAGAEVPRAELASLQHSKVINAAYFSPITGRKILTTSQDNRLRVWDYVYTSDQEPDRMIVHSNNFNRYLTPFRAEWDPKDLTERLIVCGRYISEDFGGVALHPVDLLDASTGELVSELVDPNLTTISPVNKLHPNQELIVSGNSRSLFVWRPAPDGELVRDIGLTASNSISDQLSLAAAAGYTFFDADESETPKKKAKFATGAPKTDDAGESTKKKPPRKRKKDEEGP